MDDRKQRILEAIIDDYIQTATPVGSRTISRKYLRNLSSATIRNEMSDLEELGYLAQPHVSAGRVPNAKAYRLYVDMLLAGGTLPDVDDDHFREQLFARVSHLDEMVETVAQALSDITHYASLVMLPRQEELRISTLQLVPVSKASALLVIVTDAGIIRDTMVRVAERLDADSLYAISRMLTERFAGRTLREVQSLLNEYAEHSPASPEVLERILDLSGQMDRQSRTDTLTVAGTHNILGFPEYQEADKARLLLSALEDKERLMRLIRDSGGLDLTVHIGPETGIAEMGECSVALAEYRVGRGRRGTIGLIGPTRMPYARILDTLRQVSRALTQALGE